MTDDSGPQESPLSRVKPPRRPPSAQTKADPPARSSWVRDLTRECIEEDPGPPASPLRDGTWDYWGGQHPCHPHYTPSPLRWECHISGGNGDTPGGPQPLHWAQCLGCGRSITTPGTSLLESHEEVCPFRLCRGCLNFVPRHQPCCLTGIEEPTGPPNPPIQTTMWHRDLTRECIERRPGPTPNHFHLPRVPATLDTDKNHKAPTQQNHPETLSLDSPPHGGKSAQRNTRPDAATPATKQATCDQPYGTLHATQTKQGLESLPPPILTHTHNNPTGPPYGTPWDPQSWTGVLLTPGLRRHTPRQASRAPNTKRDRNARKQLKLSQKLRLYRLSQSLDPAAQPSSLAHWCPPVRIHVFRRTVSQPPPTKSKSPPWAHPKGFIVTPQSTDPSTTHTKPNPEPSQDLPPPLANHRTQEPDGPPPTRPQPGLIILRTQPPNAIKIIAQTGRGASLLSCGGIELKPGPQKP